MSFDRARDPRLRRELLYVAATLLTLPFVYSCDDNGADSHNRAQEINETVRTVMSMISEEQAREIAHKDAAKIYRDLSIYVVAAELTDGNWHISYSFSSPTMVGGGPRYVISGNTGEILSYRYNQ